MQENAYAVEFYIEISFGLRDSLQAVARGGEFGATRPVIMRSDA
jgi:hypothetical protein